jgi:hypothetical protein
MLKGLPWWWWAGGGALLVLSWGISGTRPLPAEASAVIGIWPVLVWSAMGVRESRHRTEEIVFSAAHALSRQTAALWSAGVLVAILTWSGFGARHLAVRDWMSFMALVIGTLFIPSLALACGVWTGSSKPFEVIYTVLWYAGPMSGLTAFDFVGATRGPAPLGRSVVYLGLVGALLALAVRGRRRQIRGR